MLCLIRFLATAIGIIRLSVFELFRWMGVTVATMWLLAAGLMSVCATGISVRELAHMQHDY